LYFESNLRIASIFRPLSRAKSSLDKRRKYVKLTRHTKRTPR
jgi:hypothetical protein